MSRKVTGVRRHGAGWQAYIRVRGILYTQQFPLETPLAELKAWRRQQRELIERANPTATRGTFEHDATRYLAKVQAMPSFDGRSYDIGLWTKVFPGRARRTIQPHEIREQRDGWLMAGYAASTVNHRLRALSNLWTVLDGRHAPNPVREVPEAQEPDPQPRGVPYEMLRAILDAVPDLGQALAKQKRPRQSKTKARLRLMVWTGLTHSEIGRLERRDWDQVAGRLFVQSRRKGSGGRSRTLPLANDARAAMEAFDAAGAWGPFQRSSLHASFRTACDAVAAKQDTPKAWLPLLADLRPYDIRHSYASQLYRASGDARAAAEILGHRSQQTIQRYIGAAVDERVQLAAEAFERSTSKK